MQLISFLIGFLFLIGTVDGNELPPIRPLLRTRADSFVVASGSGSTLRRLSVPKNRSWKDPITQNNDLLRPLAHIGYADEIDTVGWSFLSVETNPDAPKADQAYAAGYAEGAASHRRLWMHLLNSGARDAFPKEQLEYVEKNLRWMHEEIAGYSRKRENSPKKTIWKHVEYILLQLEGMVAGYNDHRNSSAGEHSITFLDLLKLNLAASDSANLACVLHPAECKKNIDSLTRRDKCTMFLKPTLSGDLLVSHNANDDLNQMTRTFKRYHFPFLSSTPVTLTFSGYPGLILSTDDFTITHPALLVIMSTTLTCLGSSGFVNRTATPKKLWTFLRNAIATRVATSGESWRELFDAEGLVSGTGLNEYLVVDYKRWRARPKVQRQGSAVWSTGVVTRGTLTLVDEMPNGTAWLDLTEQINAKGWFGGWNSIHHPEMRRICRLDKVYDWTVRHFGERTAKQHYSADGTARGLVLAREQEGVETIKDMARVMRGNNWTADEYSTCDFCKGGRSPWLAVAPRNDILDPADSYGPLGPIVGARCYAAFDNKIASVAGVLASHPSHIHSENSQEGYEAGLPWIVSGPSTSEGTIPPFEWKKARPCAGMQEDFRGIPERMRFGYIRVDMRRLEPGR